MRLPDQLADIARELVVKGRQVSDPGSYVDGVRDTLVLVGELMQLAATNLPAPGAQVASAPPTTAGRLRGLAGQLHMLIAVAPAPNADLEPANPRAMMNLLRAHALVVEAAEALDPEPPAPVPAGAVQEVAGTPAEDRGDASTWLAAFVLAVVGQRPVDEQDVIDVLRLSGHDREVLAAATARVDRTPGIAEEVRTIGRRLLQRADAAADDLQQVRSTGVQGG